MNECEFPTLSGLAGRAGHGGMGDHSRQHSSGKAKKAKLKQQRLRDTERAAHREELAASDVKLGDLSEKQVRAHVFVDTGRGTRPLRILLRLKPISTAGSSTVTQPVEPLVTTEMVTIDCAAISSISKVRVALSQTCKEKSARSAAEGWCRACSDCERLLTSAQAWDANLCTELFLALQQAMQSGPLQASKAARFALLRKWCGDASIDHPHAQAAASILVATEIALERGIRFSDNQRACVIKWRKAFTKAFPTHEDQQDPDQRPDHGPDHAISVSPRSRRAQTETRSI